MCNFVFDMEQKGLTKKQFQIQMVSMALYMLLAVFWTVSGVMNESPFEWILGATYFTLVAAYAVYLIILRKKHPVEDPQLDKQAADNFKTASKGMGIVFAFITVGFLIAFGLAALFK